MSGGRNIDGQLGARRARGAASLRALWGDDVKLDDEGKGELRLMPHLHGTDGFYVAALRRP